MHKWNCFFRTTRFLATLYMVLICIGCQGPGSSQKGFGIDDPENVFFISRRKNFTLYQYNGDSLMEKAQFNKVYNDFLFYNTKLDKIYNFCIDHIGFGGGGYGIRIYDRPKARPKWFAERRTAYFSVYSYQDNYLIALSYLFPPEERANKPAVGDTVHSMHNAAYTKICLLETYEKGDRFTKEYDFYRRGDSFIRDSLIYSSLYGDFFNLNIKTGEIKKIFQYNRFYHGMFNFPESGHWDHFLGSPEWLPPPCRVLVVGNDLYMIPQNFALGTGKKEIQAYNHLYNTYKVNTLYKYVGDNEFEKVLEVPMKKDVAWATAMDDCIFFVGKKENKTELVRLDLLSKQTQQLSLNKENYLAFLAGRTKDYFILMLRNSKVKTNKHILAIVPKNLESEPKFYNLPPGFNTSNPVYFTFSSKYDNNVLGFMQDGIIRYNPENR